MKNIYAFILLMLVVLGILSCKHKKFDRIEPIENNRYSIVYNDNKCAVYDNDADSLVTEVKYDALVYGRTVTESGVELMVWASEIDGASGMLSIICENNEMMEIIFPKEQPEE